MNVNLNGPLFYSKLFNSTYAYLKNNVYWIIFNTQLFNYEEKEYFRLEMFSKLK